MNKNIILYTEENSKNQIKVGFNYCILVTDTPAFGQMEFKISMMDVQRVKKHRWRAMRVSDNKIYAYSATAGYLHRFLMNPPENMVIDHISHDTFDNRRTNLRICTQSENNANKSNTKNIVSGITQSKNGKYVVRIRKGQASLYTSTEETMEEAIKTRLINEIRLGFLAHSHLYKAILSQEEINMAAKDYQLNLKQNKIIETINTNTIKNMIIEDVA